MIEYLKKIRTQAPLSEEEMSAAMRLMMEGQASPGQIGAFLMGLSQRGESVDEIVGAAKVLREKASTIKAPYMAIDCCGTGGDQIGTYNISTAVALVAASCGVPVAKHGNRASSSKSGAADVLESLGVNLNLGPEALEEALEQLNFAFLMAPHHHSAMKHVAPVRKELGIRTIFNILGPLANPAGTRLQLIGVFDESLLVPMAESLRRLGSKKAWIVHGTDGLDEITITGPTKVTILDDGQITTQEITPADFNLKISPIEAIKGGDAAENATALRDILQGKKNAYRDIVIANTSAVLALHGKAESLRQGADMAAESLDSGHAYQTLTDYISFSRKPQYLEGTNG